MPALVTWADLLDTSPECAAVIMGVTPGQAEQEMRIAACRRSRSSRAEETEDDFKHSCLDDNSRRTALYRLIHNDRVPDSIVDLVAGARHNDPKSETQTP